MPGDASRRVDKPWGHELIWAHTDRYVGKIISIAAGKRLSLQYHEQKDESILVIDGIRKYGRGFMNSWGLSSAFSLQHGVNVRIATVLRREADMLVANEPWDAYSWPVDETATRFFAWDEREQRLVPSNWQRFLLAHPHLAQGKQS